MKVKIEVDMTEALRISGEPVYTTLWSILDSLAIEVTEPGVEGSSIYFGRGVKRGEVGHWSVE